MVVYILFLFLETITFTIYWFDYKSLYNTKLFGLQKLWYVTELKVTFIWYRFAFKHLIRRILRLLFTIFSVHKSAAIFCKSICIFFNTLQDEMYPQLMDNAINIFLILITQNKKFFNKTNVHSVLFKINILLLFAFASYFQVNVYYFTYKLQNNNCYCLSLE